MKSKLRRARLWLLYLLPAFLFFSYHPVISLGHSDSMNLELSLPFIWLVVYDFISTLAFIALFRRYGLKRSLRGISDRNFFLFSLFPLFATTSILWSPNPLRACLTVGLIWALFFAIFTTYELLAIECCKNYNTFWKNFKKSLYVSTAAVCAFCLLQCVFDLAGLPKTCTLLCRGCSFESFGFPHPNGFAIEPQFMGNLLLAPIFILLFDIIYNKKYRLSALLFLFIFTLFIVFSRGAIYAFAAAFSLSLIFRLIKTKSPRPLASLVLVILAFAAALATQGLMSELSPTSDTFASGIAKSIHQLSLGKIDFRPAPAEDTPSSTDSNFDGYVAESTDTRLMLTDYAVNLWHQSPATLLFGVGIGGAGSALAAAYPSEFTAKEIIQNQYFSLALETGAIGLALLALSLALVFKKLRSAKKPRSPAALPTFLVTALAYALSLFFFSGLANAIHIYLLLSLLLINVII